jgi:glycosyltransferase involved in cell wall biosynthesis
MLTKSASLLVSIVINNHNYARFLGDAISSCLDQNYPEKEIIVVDDGSTDNSREIIDNYGDTVSRIYKANGGQGSAINEGFLRSRGELILFLDADDILENDVLAQSVQFWDGEATKLHYRLDVIDQTGSVIGQDPKADVLLPHGDLKNKLLARGHYITPPSSGNIYSRKFLQTVMPIPAEPFRRAADSYLYTLAALHGEIIALPRVGGKYRMHGGNGFFKKRRFSTQQDLIGTLQRHERCLALMDKFTTERGLEKTYSPKYYPTPNFIRLLLLRTQEKLDYPTTFHLLGNILFGIFSDKTCNLPRRLEWISKMLLVAFAPLRMVWWVYPNTRPQDDSSTGGKPASSFAFKR